MDLDELSKNLLIALAHEPAEKDGAGISMWKAGESLGLSRSETQDLVMDLSADGYVEIKSLSGKVLVTTAGYGLVGPAGSGSGSAAALDKLAALVAGLDSFAAGLDPDQASTGDLQLDISVLKSQLKRSEKLDAVVMGVLKALTQKSSVAAEKAPAELMDLIMEHLSSEV